MTVLQYLFQHWMHLAGYIVTASLSALALIQDSLQENRVPAWVSPPCLSPVTATASELRINLRVDLWTPVGIPFWYLTCKFPSNLAVKIY